MIQVMLPVGIREIRPVELIEVVRVDVDAPGPPIAAAPERSADHSAGAERNAAANSGGRVARRVPRIRRIAGIRPVAVDSIGIVSRNVDRLRIGGVDYHPPCFPPPRPRPDPFLSPGLGGGRDFGPLPPTFDPLYDLFFFSP